MNLLNELLSLKEVQNHMGETEYGSFSAWKTACRKANADVWFDGNKEIANAFVGPNPYKRGETLGIGEWDGEKGTVSLTAASKKIVKEGNEARVEQLQKQLEQINKQMEPLKKRAEMINKQLEQLGGQQETAA